MYNLFGGRRGDNIPLGQGPNGGPPGPPGLPLLRIPPNPINLGDQACNNYNYNPINHNQINRNIDFLDGVYGPHQRTKKLSDWYYSRHPNQSLHIANTIWNNIINNCNPEFQGLNNDFRKEVVCFIENKNALQFILHAGMGPLPECIENQIIMALEHHYQNDFHIKYLKYKTKYLQLKYKTSL